MTRMQSDKHNNMLNVVANLKHVETHENTNWRLVSAVDWTTTELVCLQRSLLGVSVVLACCTDPCLHDWSHGGSSLCLVRLIVIAMSHGHLPHFPSLQFPLTSCTSYCFSPSSSLMWTTTTRTAAEELGPPGQEELLHTWQTLAQNQLERLTSQILSSGQQPWKPTALKTEHAAKQ